MYTSSDVITLTAKPLDGYTFKQWTGELGGITDPSQNPVTFPLLDDPDGGRSITATFAKIGSSSWVSSYWWVLVAGLVAIGGLSIVLIFGLLIFLRKNGHINLPI
jgi:hypothetical protein